MDQGAELDRQTARMACRRPAFGRLALAMLLLALLVSGPAEAKKRRRKSSKGGKAAKASSAAVGADGSVSNSVLPDELPDDVAELRRLAAQHAAEMPETAAGLLMRALEIEADSADILFELGNLCLTRGVAGGVPSAVQHFSRAAELEPGLSEAHIALGISLQQVRERRGAIRAFRKALKAGGADPDAKDAHQAAKGNGKLSSARVADVREMMGALLLESGQPRKALAQFTALLAQPAGGAEGTPEARAAKANPSLAKLRLPNRKHSLGAAKAHMELGSPRDALQHFEAACKVEESSDCLEGQASALMRMGRSEQANAVVARAVAKAPPGLARHYKKPFIYLAPQLVAASRGGGSGEIVVAGQSMQVEQLSRRPGPDVYRVRGFLSEEEADGIVQLYRARQSGVATEPLVCFSPDSPQLRRFSSVVAAGGAEMTPIADPAFGDRMCFNASDPVASQPDVAGALSGLAVSDSTFAYRGESELIDAVEQRIEAVAGLSAVNALSTQLLSYSPGVSYAEHTDCSPRLQRADRAVTALVYLTDVSEGGETVFPRIGEEGLSIRPEKGMLVLFTSFEPENGWCDPNSIHAANPVGSESEEKVVIQKWYMQRPLPSAASGRFGDKMGSYTAPEQPFTLCDRSGSCRRYFPFAAANDE